MGMTDSQVQDLAERFCSILMAHASHGFATSSLDGMGEITLRDGLIVAAAAAGASQKQVWLFEREDLPNDWTDSAVDLTIYRKGNSNETKAVGAIELKWWRQIDKGNASNRRRDLIKDFIRAAANYKNVEGFSFVALLSTEVSWTSTTTTHGGDQDTMAFVTGEGTQKWKLEEMLSSPAVLSAVRSLGHRVPISNIFHTKLLATLDLRFASGRTASAKVWNVVKPQRTLFFDDRDLKKYFGIKPRAAAQADEEE